MDGGICAIIRCGSMDRVELHHKAMMEGVEKNVTYP